MIHKNWAELIKPTQLEIKPGADSSAWPPSSRNRWNAASA